MDTKSPSVLRRQAARHIGMSVEALNTWARCECRVKELEAALPPADKAVNAALTMLRAKGGGTEDATPCNWYATATATPVTHAPSG